MKKLIKPVRRILGAYFIIAYVKATRLMPLSWARKSGLLMANLAYYLVPPFRRSGLKNLDFAYGDSISQEEKARILKGSYQNMGMVAAEFSRIAELGTAEGLNRVRVLGADQVDWSKGGLMVCAHMANWEWMAAALGSRGVQVMEVVNDTRNRIRDRFVDAMRRSGHLGTIPRTGAASAIRQALREKKIVGILVDQSPRESAVPVTMFGRPCWATAGPAFLALRTGALLYVAKGHREPDGSYVLEFSEPVAYERSGDFRRDLREISQRLQDEVESNVREYPGQWLWTYNRWRKRKGLDERWAKRRAAPAEDAEEPPARKAAVGESPSTDQDV